MKARLAATRGRKQGAMDGVTLFFGALLGANLGTLDGLKLVHYIELIAILAGMVMALRLVSTLESRRHGLRLLLVYGLLLGLVMAFPGMRPEGMAIDDLHKLLATMSIWVFLAMIVEFSPLKEDGASPVPDGAPPEAQP